VPGVVQIRLKRLDVGNHPVMIPASTAAQTVCSDMNEQLSINHAGGVASTLQDHRTLGHRDTGAGQGQIYLHSAQYLPMRWKVWLGMCSRWPMVSQGPRCETRVVAYHSARLAVTFADLKAAPLA